MNAALPSAAASPARSALPDLRLAAWLGLCVVLAAVLTALGVWQLQRLGWKQDLIAQVQRQRVEPAAPAPGPPAWAGLARERDEYRRVTVQGRYLADADTFVQATTEFGTGHWVLSPLRTDAGWWVLVNRGFVPSGMPRDALAAPAGRVQVQGLLRLSERSSWLRTNQPAQQRWRARDVAAIGEATGLGPALAPFFIDAPADPAVSWPRGGLTVLQFRNHHGVYALTWFLLAGGAVALGALLWRDARRQRSAAAQGDDAGAGH